MTRQVAASSSQGQAMKFFFLKFASDESGASSIEYVFLLAFIVLAIVSSLIPVGTKISGVLDNAGKF